MTRGLRQVVTLLGLTLAVGANAQTFYVGTCKPGKADFATIQEAVTNAPSGGTINVCPGTYPEQVTIQQPLTLKGVTSGNNANVVITAPASGLILPNVVSTQFAVAGQLEVLNTTGPVNISDITVDGTGLTLEAPAVADSGAAAGILYDSAAGSLTRVVVQNLQPSDAIFTVGILALDDSGTSPAFAVKNSVVRLHNDGAGKSSTGIEVFGHGATISMDIENNYIFNTNNQFSLGIQTTETAGGTISGNIIDLGNLGTAEGIFVDVSAATTVSGNSVNNVQSGVLISGGGPTSVTNNSLSTTVVGVQMFSGTETGVTIKGNQIWSSTTGTGVSLGCQANVALSGNVIVGGSVGLLGVPSGVSFAKSAGTFLNVPNIEQLCP
jgi:Periplasmic copper-binding protein (NosD)